MAAISEELEPRRLDLLPGRLDVLARVLRGLLAGRAVVQVRSEGLTLSEDADLVAHGGCRCLPQRAIDRAGLAALAEALDEAHCACHFPFGRLRPRLR